MKKHYLSKDLLKSYLIPGVAKHNIVGRYYSKALASNKKLSTISYFKYNKLSKHSEYSSFTDRDLSQNKVIDKVIKGLLGTGLLTFIVTRYFDKKDTREKETKKQILDIENQLAEYGEIVSRDHTSKVGMQKANIKNQAKRIMSEIIDDHDLLLYFKGQIRFFKGEMQYLGTKEMLEIKEVAEINYKLDYVSHFRDSFAALDDTDEVEEEVTVDRLGIETLVQLAHCCNSVATNKLYNLHAARNELKQVKEIIEQRIAKESGVDIEKLINEQNYRFAISELKCFGNDLLAEYTILKYLYARSYIYEYAKDKKGYNKLSLEEKEEIKKRFVDVKKLSMGLGNQYSSKDKYKMLEHITSQRNGINIIRDWEIEGAIEKGDKETAKRLIAENIESYKQIRNGSSKYIIEYELGKRLEEQHKKSLEYDKPNFLTCEKQLIKYYGLWAKVATGSEKTRYLADFEQVFITLESSLEFSWINFCLELKLLDIIKDPKISQNDQASAMLNIGSSLINLYGTELEEVGLAVGKICKLIKGQLSEVIAANGIRVEDITDLELIESLIDVGSLARADYRLQARDSYEQLIQLKLKELNNPEITDDKKVDIAESMMRILEKRNKLNELAHEDTKKEYKDDKLHEEIDKIISSETNKSKIEKLPEETDEIKKKAEKLCPELVKDIEQHQALGETELSGAIDENV